MSPSVSRSLSAGESQLQDGALLGGVSPSLNSRSCVVPSHSESDRPMTGSKSEAVQSRPRPEET